MVPHDERERLENLFKGPSEAVNCFVCTATLELGVDIGALDAVLMRNVPPLPANYWQRGGRAGRRHRMAVDLTYCRPVSHDRAYFAQPEKLLAGRDRPAGLQPEQRRDGQEARQRFGTDRAPAAQPRRGQGSRVVLSMADEGADPDSPRKVPAAPGVLLVVRWRFGARLPVQLRAARRDHPPPSPSTAWPRRTPPSPKAGQRRMQQPSAPEVLGQYIDGLHRRSPGRGTISAAAAGLGARTDRATEQPSPRARFALDREDDALFWRCDQLVKRLKGRESPESPGRAGPSGREHLQRAGGAGIPARLRPREGAPCRRWRRFLSGIPGRSPSTCRARPGSPSGSTSQAT